MTWLIGDSFDAYAAIADASANFWSTSASWALSASGRFTGSQCYQNNSNSATTQTLAYSSGSNDATHHIICSFIQTSSIQATATNIIWITFFDASTAQCSIVFRNDGSIILTSGASSGSTLDTYSNAFYANVWYGIEIELTINNSTGAWHIRKNGNSVDDHAATSLVTRGGTANNYANKIAIGSTSNVFVQRIDDFIWLNTSGSAPNTWVGDVRSTLQLPVSDSSVQFTISPNPSTITLPQTSTNTATDATGTARYSVFTATYDGTIGTLVVNMNASATGNLKCTIFTDNVNTPSTILGSATTLVNPVSGTNTITFSSPPTVVQNTKYWIGFSHDVSMTFKVGAASGATGTGVAYASFPTASPTIASLQQDVNLTVNITPTLNYQFVNEAQEDGTTSYVFDSTIGHADSYGLTSLATTPTAIIGVQTRLFVEKSDTLNARTGELQVQSGTTTVNTTLVLSTAFQWISRIDTVDPNTSSAWTASGFNAILIGPEVNA